VLAATDEVEVEVELGIKVCKISVVAEPDVGSVVTNSTTDCPALLVAVMV
jgi:hypothetical protein